MRILVVFTGGTIGSAKNGKWISLDPKSKDNLICGYQQKHNGKVEFISVCPFEMHSENLSPERLTKLINFLCESENKGYDGIIVTHGTDTLQYSAAAASYCLKAKKPIVFVSSNYPLEDEKANGHLNFEAAVEFILSKESGGVYVSYSNDNITAELHIADKVFYHPELSDKILSVGVPPFSYKNNGIIKNSVSVEKSGKNSFGAVEFCKNPKILRINVTPFEQYLYDPKDYNAVVLSPYHSGTLNTENKKFREFCDACVKSKTPLLLPDVPADSSYDSMREYEALGITALKEVALIPLLVKIWIAVSLNKNIVESLVE